MVSNNMLLAHEGKKIFSEKNSDLCLLSIKCLKQIRKHTLLLTCDPISKLLTNISTMINIFKLSICEKMLDLFK